ncbi:MAG TPA: thioredoxin domain-containing protein [Pseudonocardiaceae bacterium]|nr:thioredoxin domain-containing protein [Pseudonocardiaceae bacterium]
MTVGGAQRGNRKRKQNNRTQAARTVAAARGTNKDLPKIIIGVAVVLVIAVAVVVGVVLQQNRATQTNNATIPPVTTPSGDHYPGQFDKSTATVLVGKPTAKITIDAYEDFLCSVCGEFESTNFTAVDQQLAAGTIKVRYHMVDILNQASVPPGYSLMAANTALALATVAPDKFIDYHYSLYQDQPKENGPGYTQAQLNSLASRSGLTGAAYQQFLTLVNNKTYETQLTNNTNAAASNSALFQQNQDGSKGFGTPTIVSGGQIQNWQNDPNWLNTLVKTAYPS